MSIYDINVKDKKGDDVSISKYKGKVLLIINSATKCGFTKQYDELEALYSKYKDKGFEILDFPCNQFGNQAPGSDEEISSFCTLKFGLTFPQFKKIDVNGENESPLFTFLKSKKRGVMGSNIKWNFTKFLVDKQGNVIERFSPMTTPDKIESSIVKLLEI